MAYSTKSDIQEILSDEDLIQLTDDSDPVDTVDDTKITSAIKRADNEINTFLRGKHDLPVTSAIALAVKDWSVSLAIYQLYRRRINLEIPDVLRDDIEDVRKKLGMVQAGTLLIDDPTSTANTAGIYKGSGQGSTAGKSQIFVSQPDGKGFLDQYYNGLC